MCSGPSGRRPGPGQPFPPLFFFSTFSNNIKHYNKWGSNKEVIRTELNKHTLGRYKETYNNLNKSSSQLYTLWFRNCHFYNHFVQWTSSKSDHSSNLNFILITLYIILYNYCIASYSNRFKYGNHFLLNLTIDISILLT